MILLSREIPPFKKDRFTLYHLTLGNASNILQSKLLLRNILQSKLLLRNILQSKLLLRNILQSKLLLRNILQSKLLLRDILQSKTLLHHILSCRALFPNPASQNPAALFIPPNDSSFAQIIGRKLQCYLISRQNTDKILAQLSADMCKNLMPVLKLNLKHRIRQLFNHNSFDFNHVALRHLNPPFLPDKLKKHYLFNRLLKFLLSLPP